MKIYFETCFKNFLCFVTFEYFGECDQYKKTPSSPFCILKVFVKEIHGQKPGDGVGWGLT